MLSTASAEKHVGNLKSVARDVIRGDRKSFLPFVMLSNMLSKSSHIVNSFIASISNIGGERASRLIAVLQSDFPQKLVDFVANKYNMLISAPKNVKLLSIVTGVNKKTVNALMGTFVNIGKDLAKILSKGDSRFTLISSKQKEYVNNSKFRERQETYKVLLLNMVKLLKSFQSEGRALEKNIKGVEKFVEKFLADDVEDLILTDKLESELKKLPDNIDYEMLYTYVVKQMQDGIAEVITTNLKRSKLYEDAVRLNFNPDLYRTNFTAKELLQFIKRTIALDVWYRQVLPTIEASAKNVDKTILDTAFDNVMANLKATAEAKGIKIDDVKVKNKIEFLTERALVANLTDVLDIFGRMKDIENPDVKEVLDIIDNEAGALKAPEGLVESILHILNKNIGALNSKNYDSIPAMIAQITEVNAKYRGAYLRKLYNELSKYKETVNTFLDNYLAKFFDEGLVEYIRDLENSRIDKMLNALDKIFSNKDYDVILKNLDSTTKLQFLRDTLYSIFTTNGRGKLHGLLKSVMNNFILDGDSIDTTSLKEAFYKTYVEMVPQKGVYELNKQYAFLDSAVAKVMQSNELVNNLVAKAKGTIYDLLTSKMFRGFMRSTLSPLYGFSNEFKELNKEAKLFVEDFNARLHMVRKEISERENVTKPEIINLFNRIADETSATIEGAQPSARVMDVLIRAFEAFHPILMKAEEGLSKGEIKTRKMAYDTLRTTVKEFARILKAVKDAGKMEDFADLLFKMYLYSDTNVKAHDTIGTEIREKIGNIIHTSEVQANLVKYLNPESNAKTVEEIGVNRNDAAWIQAMLTHDFIGTLLVGAMTDPKVMGFLGEVAPHWASAAYKLKMTMTKLTMYAITNGLVGAKEVMDNPKYIPLRYMLAGKNILKMRHNDVAQNRLIVSGAYYYDSYKQNVGFNIASALVDWYKANKERIENISVAGNTPIKAKELEEVLTSLYKVLLGEISNAPFLVRLLARSAFEVANLKDKTKLAEVLGTYGIDLDPETQAKYDKLLQTLKENPVFAPNHIFDMTTGLLKKLITENDPLKITLNKITESEGGINVDEHIEALIDDLFSSKNALAPLVKWMEAMDILTGTQFGTEVLRNMVSYVIRDILIPNPDVSSAEVINKMFNYANFNAEPFVKLRTRVSFGGAKPVSVVKDVIINDITNKVLSSRRNLDPSYRDMLWVTTNPVDALLGTVQKYVNIAKVDRYVGDLLQATSAVRIVTKDDKDALKDVLTKSPDMYEEISLSKLLASEDEFSKRLAIAILSSNEFNSRLTLSALNDVLTKETPVNKGVNDFERYAMELDDINRAFAKAYYDLINNETVNVYISKEFWQEYKEMSEAIKKVKSSKESVQAIWEIVEVAKSILSAFRYEYSASVLILNPVSWERNIIGALITPIYTVGGKDYLKYLKLATVTMLSGGSKGATQEYLTFNKEVPVVPLSVPRYSLEEFTLPQSFKTGRGGKYWAYKIGSTALTLPAKTVNTVAFKGLTKLLQLGLGEELATKAGFSELDDFHVAARLRTLYGMVDRITMFSIYLAAREGKIKTPEYIRNPAYKALAHKLKKYSPKLAMDLMELYDKEYMPKMTPKEAVRWAEQFSFTYYELPMMWRFLRQVANPFISFVYNAGKVVGNAMLKYPSRTLAMTLLYREMNEYLESNYGINVSLDTIVPGLDWLDAMSVVTEPLRGGELPPMNGSALLSAPFIKFMYMMLMGEDPFSHRPLTFADSLIGSTAESWIHSFIPAPPALDLPVRTSLYGLMRATASPQTYELMYARYKDYVDALAPQSWLSKKLIDQGLRGMAIDSYGTRIRPWMSLIYALTGLNIQIKDQIKLRSKLDYRLRAIDRLRNDIDRLERDLILRKEEPRNFTSEIRKKKKLVERYLKEIADIYRELGIEPVGELEDYDNPDMGKILLDNATRQLLSLFGIQMPEGVADVSIGRRY